MCTHSQDKLVHLKFPVVYQALKNFGLKLVVIEVFPKNRNEEPGFETCITYDETDIFEKLIAFVPE